MADIRYFKLQNKGAFVARMQVIWHGKDTKGNAVDGVYEPGGYHDVLAAAERTIDLNETNIPDAAEVHLKVVVVAGRDREASERHKFTRSSGGMATYEISGTTLINTLKELSVG